ncbi:hypothetical protein PUR49_13810 [Streptomyces sp. BE147]|uniref:hypothetical protein n=1 Tax=Streptomyces sp. BE147 TaxID=3002524 RepID=UPI002E774A2C|nr:hypothetical protein [Streptomyces sp. BE147]MEE1737566.1 hypothetical protein [Streptomyces sp. BE147]
MANARFLTRTNKTLGKAGDERRVVRHDERPARLQLAAWPTAKGEETGSAGRVEEMAG